MRSYRAQLGRAKWVSMLDLKAGFHNIPFETTSSYNSTFVTHRGKFWWLRMPMGLTYLPANFQFVVESTLHGELDDCPLPVVVYLDDIAMYGDTQEQVLEDMLEAVKRFTTTGFMLNLCKSQLVQAAVQVLRHLWTSGSFWVPKLTKLATLIEKMDGELARFNRASLYGLLNFYRECVPAFAKLVELLRQLLGQDTRPWMPEAGECIREVARRVITVPHWLNADLTVELGMETRVSSRGIDTLLLQ